MDKVQKKNLRIPVKFEKVSEIGENDERFVKVKIKILHLGLNYNGSIFEKDVVDKAIPTLAYIPIVGFIKENHNGEIDFSDHRYVYIEQDGEIVEKYLGVPYGIVLSNEDNNAHYEQDFDDNGTERTYLVVDGVLWDMFDDGVSIFERDSFKSQSMELANNPNSYDGYYDDNDYYHFTKFSFRAACVLGEDYEPAMAGSTITPYFSMNDFVDSFQNELMKKFEKFSKLENINLKNNIEQGGNESMNKNKNDFSISVQQHFDDVSSVVKNYETLENEWGGKYARYFAVDIQDNEVIVCDRKSDYQYYGFNYTVDGDKPNVDFSNAVRKKVVYVNYEEGANDNVIFSIGKEIQSIKDTAFEKITEADKAKDEAVQAKEVAETNYTQLKTDYDTIKPKYDEYVKTEQARIENEIKVAKDNEIQKYENVLGADKEFVELKQHISEYSVDEIKSKCAIIHSNKMFANINFSKQTGTDNVALGIDDSHSVDEGVIETTRYGNILINR